jgi:hypothetical protein
MYMHADAIQMYLQMLDRYCLHRSAERRNMAQMWLEGSSTAALCLNIYPRTSINWVRTPPSAKIRSGSASWKEVNSALPGLIASMR